MRLRIEDGLMPAGQHKVRQVPVVAKCASLPEERLPHVVVAHLVDDGSPVCGERSRAAQHHPEQALRCPLLMERHPVTQGGETSEHVRARVTDADRSCDRGDASAQERTRECLESTRIVEDGVRVDGDHYGCRRRIKPDTLRCTFPHVAGQPQDLPSRMI